MKNFQRGICIIPDYQIVLISFQLYSSRVVKTTDTQHIYKVSQEIQYIVILVIYYDLPTKKDEFLVPCCQHNKQTIHDHCRPN